MAFMAHLAWRGAAILTGVSPQNTFPLELILEVGKFLASPFDGSLRALLSLPQVFSGMCNGTVPRMGSTQEMIPMKVATLTIKLDGENCFVVANGIALQSVETS